MSTTAEQMRTYAGPALLSYGFRPFFLGGAVWAVCAVLLWVLLLMGAVELPSAFSAVEWHVHELLYGYLPAIIAGFLLTAVPNWTGRLPVVGAPLLMLASIWIAGRFAVFFSALIGPVAAAFIDALFLVSLALVIARELIAGANAKNIKVLAVIGVLTAGNVTFHLEASTGVGDNYGMRIGIAAAIALIMIIGGRIIPSFTRNWLARQASGPMPQQFDLFDKISILLSCVTLAIWVLLPDGVTTAILTLMVGGANVWRLSRWAGQRTMSEPLVLVLHVAYGFIPLGFFLLALSIAFPAVISQAGALHAWTIGAIGLMTLAVMTRASLGHAGQPLVASSGIRVIYVTAIVAAATRLIAAFDVWYDVMVQMSALAWVVSFMTFVFIFAPFLVRPRR